MDYPQTFNTSFFVGAVIFPFNMIHAKARKIDSQNPKEAASGYKNSDTASFFERRTINSKKSSRNFLIDVNYHK